MQREDGDFELIEHQEEEDYLIVDDDSDGGINFRSEDSNPLETEHVSHSVFSKKASKREKWEQRNTSIHSTVYDPSGQSIELRHLLNGKGKLVCWDPIQNNMEYAHKNKNGTFTINGLICTKQPLERACDSSLNPIKF